jgi:large subunit ribosomal protein L29
MPILRIKEIASMSSEEKETKLAELRAELARMKTMIRAGGAVDNPTRVRELKKTIAKILTIANEQKLKLREAAPEPEKEEAKKPEKKAPKAKKTKETKSE